MKKFLGLVRRLLPSQFQWCLEIRGYRIFNPSINRFLSCLFSLFFLATLLETQEIFDGDYSEEKVCLLKISRFRVFKSIPPKSSSLTCQSSSTLLTSTVNRMTTQQHQHCRTTIYMFEFQLRRSVISYLSPRWGRCPKNINVNGMTTYPQHINILGLPYVCIDQLHFLWLVQDPTLMHSRLNLKFHATVVNLVHYNSSQGPMILFGITVISHKHIDRLD